MKFSLDSSPIMKFVFANNFRHAMQCYTTTKPKIWWMERLIWWLLMERIRVMWEMHQINFILIHLLLSSIECALGMQYKFNIPFIYLNTVGFYTNSVSRAGSPTPYSITPSFAIAMTDNMNFIQRVTNSLAHVTLSVSHAVSYENELFWLNLDKHVSKFSYIHVWLAEWRNFVYDMWFWINVKIMVW
jgi:hypothetical protein